MYLVYIAAPYRTNKKAPRAQNIGVARSLAKRIWVLGHVAVCPHLNSELFDMELTLNERTWLDGYLKLMSRCDIILVGGNWEYSMGTQDEIAHARAIGIPVVFSINNLQRYLKGDRSESVFEITDGNELQAARINRKQQ